jgi:integrase
VNGYKRCKCRDAAGKEIGASCPKLKRRDDSWNPSHGTWYGKAELPADASGHRVVLKQGGFRTEGEMQAWLTAATHLMAIPDAGEGGMKERAQILALIRESRRAKAPLPEYDDLRRRYREGVAFDPGTTGEYLLDWIVKRRELEDLAPTTLLSYEAVVRRLCLPAFGHIPLDKLRSSHVLAMLADIDAEADRVRAARASGDPEVRASVAGRRPTGLASKRRYLAVLRSALNAAMAPEERRITANPADIRIGKGARKQKQQRPRAKLWTTERVSMWAENYEALIAAAGDPGKVARFAMWRSMPARPGPVMIWTPAQLGAFLDAIAGDRLYAMLCLISHCGLRRGEACGLRWEDVDFEAAAIMISNQIVQVGWKTIEAEPKSDASQALVRLDPVSVPALRAWRLRQLEERVAWGSAWASSKMAFTRENGLAYHPAQVTARFERLAFDAGLPPIRLHDLRHGAATLALAAGADIKAVSSMLRHSSIQITADIYADVLPELASEVASKVASMVPRRALAEGASIPDGLPTVSLGRTSARSLHPA